MPEAGRGGEPAGKPPNKFVPYLRECLLLLAIQVVTVTYVAGLNTPGGVWPETKDGHLGGNPILASTNYVRYNAFNFSNTAALVASGAVVLLLLFVRGKMNEIPWFNTVLRAVMSLGMLALAVAYATGASRNQFTTNYAIASVVLLFVCVLVFTCFWIFSSQQEEDFSLASPTGRAMFSAIYVMSMAYMAGLSPPGAFWLDTQEGHLAGDPALPVYHRHRFRAFFVGNTMAFVGSLFRIPLVLTDKGVGIVFTVCWNNICDLVVSTGLTVAYASGSCIDNAYIAYVLLSGFVIMPVIGIMLVIQFKIRPRIMKKVKGLLQKCLHNNRATGSSPTSSSQDQAQDQDDHDGMDPFFILLFTTISATVTYQAGFSPPGGLWLDNLDGHKAGDPILLAKQPARYRVFMFCNSMALVASLVSIVMALTKKCQAKRSRALDGLILLDLIGLVGAYAAGCCRDVQTSIHVISLGGAIIVYVVFHMAFVMPRKNEKLLRLIEEDKNMDLDRDLMLGILGAALTYQTGLTPPGGFWQSDDEFGHHAGEPVLLSTYPNRYKVFFYLNALCFMASIFLTILFVNPLLYRAGIRCRALFVCVLAVLFGLVGGYAAGSYRNLGPSIYIIVMCSAVFVFVISILYLLHRDKSSEPSSTSNPSSGDEQKQVQKLEGGEQENVKKPEGDEQESKEGKQNEVHVQKLEVDEQKEVQKPEGDEQESKEGKQNKVHVQKLEGDKQEPKEEKQNQESKEEKQNKALAYLVLIGSVGASVTYLAAFAPPRSFWTDNSNGHAVGNPALRDMDAHRYRIFFFFNTTSFAASVFIMNSGLFVQWLFDETEEHMDAIYTIIQAPATVYAIGILGAYAAGSSSGWNNNSTYGLALVAPVLFCIFLIDPAIYLLGKMAKSMKRFEE